MNKSDILGIDVGSVAISLAQVGPKKEIVKTAYGFHHGDVGGRLRGLLADFDLTQIRNVAVVNGVPNIIFRNREYDSRVSLIEAARHFHGRLGALLVVGGEKFSALFFDANGDYRKFRANTSCAAGTGSFLDQQARRLNLKDAEELGQLALQNTGPPPKIASRCAVFAKTDLVHAQQEGYSLEAICDGLCRGLAKSVFDTLFAGEKMIPPIVFAGGVSNNQAVVKHFERFTGIPMITGGAHVYGALGAALCLLDELANIDPVEIASPEDLILPETRERRHFYPPLTLALSDYPDFSGHESYEFRASAMASDYAVEVDIYRALESDCEYEGFLGVDIGSTSTKAVLMDRQTHVLAGFYTRTAGRPVEATQKIFACIDDLLQKNRARLTIVGAGTTGAGRKFIGALIGADLILDEITAHARAAVELRPDVDTIIEIGGQDSKFTTLANGSVTFSVMNTVCAAGTGSFIEEQAQKLGCPLVEYAQRAANSRSPIVSDRCTVFMERDINHYLSEGYTVREMLASALHSVRENYLTKVAVPNSIGDSICFQGATAKNKALVAAFEYKFKKPIHVSRYCHLTGALGAALTLSDRGVSATRFRGIGLHRQTIPVRTEVCELCANNCKITVANLDGENVAYGFLCGRDYDTGKYVDNNRSGFDLLRQRKKAAVFQSGDTEPEPLIGLPSALYMHEDLAFWKKFFNTLSIRTRTDAMTAEDVSQGKQMAGAEFCAPMAALHGQVNRLLKEADYVFLPFLLDRNKPENKDARRQLCYYSQYAPAVVSSAVAPEDEKRLLMPLAGYLYSSINIRMQLYKTLRPVIGKRLNFIQVAAAYDAAARFRETCQERFKEIYAANIPDGVHVVLLGRPYTVLSKSMNKGIPDIFASLGIRAFFQDMLDYDEEELEPIRPLLNEIHWCYAAEILAAAQKVAITQGAYPVYITSFRCSPDSFAIEYFKKLMESHQKPHLILQLDEHNSSLGYETRIEAAVRSFTNHYRQTKRPEPVYAPSLIPSQKTRLDGRTLLIPNWDNLSLRMIVASLRREGVDARLLEETGTSIRKSLGHNTGQCIPLNIVAQEFMDYIQNHDLDPAKTVMWNIRSSLACNLRLFPHHIRFILSAAGNGMEKAGVYVGPLTFMEFSVKLPIDNYLAYKFGGLIRKIGCRLRPYEKEKGAVDRVIAQSADILEDAFAGARSKGEAVEDVVSRFEAVEIDQSQRRPKAAIFGDLYVRDNDVINQDLVRFIEQNGGEVVTTPYSDYIKMVAGPYFRKWLVEGEYFSVISSKALIAALRRFEKRYYGYFERVLKEPEPVFDDSPKKILSQYNVLIENTGESMDNLLKVYYTAKRHPDLSLFVQTNPAFCCPSLVTEAMANRIEQITGVPVVTVTYDGTGGVKNDVITPYLKYPK